MFFRLFWFLSPIKVIGLHINAARTKDFGDELVVTKHVYEFTVRAVKRIGLPQDIYFNGNESLDCVAEVYS